MGANRLWVGLAAVTCALLAPGHARAAPSCPGAPAGWTLPGPGQSYGSPEVDFTCDYYQGGKHVPIEASYSLPSDPGNVGHGCGIGARAWTTTGREYIAVSKTTWAGVIIDDYDVQMAPGDVGGFTAAADSLLASVEGLAKACPAATKPATTTTKTTEKWPPAPVDPEVSLASVSNGCGGGVASEEGRFGDTSTFRDSNDPTGKRYVVNFRLACNLHDAGYSGAKVADPINGGVVDFYGWSQKRVDEQFLANMRRLCKEQIPPEATVAREDCLATGGKTSFGAETRYNFVRSQGFRFYGARPNLTSTWSGNGVEFVITQHLRSVTVTWSGGEIRGTIVSRDQDSVVVGAERITASGNVYPTTIKVDPDKPNVLDVEVSDGRYVTLTRR